MSIHINEFEILKWILKMNQLVFSVKGQKLPPFFWISKPLYQFMARPQIFKTIRKQQPNQHRVMNWRIASSFHELKV